MPETINFKVGNSVIVKPGVLDPDLGTDIGGWQGRISEINSSSNIIGIDWDSITLKNMPEVVIEKSVESGWGWNQMYLEPREVELTQPRDKEEDVAMVIKEIEAKHRWSYLGEEGKGIQAVLADVELEDEMEAFEAWSKHLSKVLKFPFEAEVAEWQEKGPLRGGDKVTVIKMASVAEMYGIIVRVKHQRRRADFPLSELMARDSSSSNYEFLRDYVVWFANR